MCNNMKQPVYLNFQILPLHYAYILCISPGDFTNLLNCSWIIKSLHKNNAALCGYNPDSFLNYGYKSNGI